MSIMGAPMRTRCVLRRMVCDWSPAGVRLDGVESGVVRFDPMQDGRVDVFITNQEGGYAVAYQPGWSTKQIRALAAELVRMCDKMEAPDDGEEQGSRCL